LENEEDTSYFDTRADRYNHEFDDTDDTDDSPVPASKYFFTFKNEISTLFKHYFLVLHLIRRNTESNTTVVKFTTEAMTATAV
jgi:hypothetical protein